MNMILKSVFFLFVVSCLQFPGCGQIKADNQYAITPFLQSPTSTSIYICWQSGNADQTTVLYGSTPDLGLSQEGVSIPLSTYMSWHSVNLSGLEPSTEYFYRCVSGNDASDIQAFRTQPDELDENEIIRFIVYGDTRTDIAMHSDVVTAIVGKVGELYGPDLQNQINVVLHVGDIVTNGNNLAQFRNEFIAPLAPIAAHVPVMVSIGNHERESRLYYDHMKYEDFGGSEGEKYYSFRIGSVIFIALNTNIRGDTQVQWLRQTLDNAQTDPGIRWIFAFCHHPGHTELWPDGNMPWVNNIVIPMLSEYDKAECIMYGHTHNYERGQTRNGHLRLLLCGGGGAELDRWGAVSNQTDYPEISNSFDHHCYTIFEIETGSGCYTATTYSLGHPDRRLGNVMIDRFSRDRNFPPPATPLASVVNLDNPSTITLMASDYSGISPHMTSHFQVSASGDFSNPVHEACLDFEDFYGDTGSPDYIPVNRNAGIDLTRLTFSRNLLSSSGYLFWRVRYRDQNLSWSGWSEPMSISLQLN